MADITPFTGGRPGLLPAGRRSSDQRLARLASRGNARAFALLYERHHQALYRYCLAIVRAPEDAQDALQNTFMNAFAALRASERDVAVRPWLFRVAHNEAVSILRRRRPNEPLEEQYEPSRDTVETSVAQRERLAQLVADLQQLPIKQRAALLMRELSGLSIEELASALGVSAGAAKQTLFEARSSLHAFAKGRDMECEAVRRAISDGDGRVLRARDVRAHLRACSACSEFRALIDSRTAELQALAPPLPAAASASVLAGLLAHGGGGLHAGGAVATSAAASAGTSAAGLGSHAAASVALKGITGLAIAAAAGAGAAQLIPSTGGSARRPAHTRPGAVGVATGNRSAPSAATSSEPQPAPGRKAQAHSKGPPQQSRGAAANGRAEAPGAPGTRGAHGSENGRGQAAKGVRGAARAGTRKGARGHRHLSKRPQTAHKAHDHAAKEAAPTGAHKQTSPPGRSPLLAPTQPRGPSESRKAPDFGAFPAS